MVPPGGLEPPHAVQEAAGALFADVRSRARRIQNAPTWGFNSTQPFVLIRAGSCQLAVRRDRVTGSYDWWLEAGCASARYPPKKPKPPVAQRTRATTS